MPMDGFTLSFMQRQLRQKLLGGRVDKVNQPERDALVLLVRSAGGNHRLLLSANASLPLLYLTDDDEEPVRAAREVIPFRFTAEADGITEDSVWQMNLGLEQLTAVMLGGDTVEVKAVIAADVLVLQPVREPVVTGVQTAPLDVKKLQELPGIVGYVVQPGDTLWKIAKKFHTTVDNIKETNSLAGEEIKPGDRLILIKEIW